ncbi:MAG: hypothetical protein LW714_08475 [Oxalobacteraceae bacterium]|nr:hypothetical protein [Oxalobacteraceae bacterium]
MKISFTPHFFSLFSAMFFRLFFLAILAVLPLQSQSLAMGEVTVRSALGQLLDADIDVTILSAQETESLSARLASPEMFAEAGLEYSVLTRSLRLSIEKKGDRPVIHLSSEKAITEPYLMVMVEVSAGGNRSVRQYALLLDPAPVQNEPPASTVDTVLPKISPVPAPTIMAPPKTTVTSKRERKANDSVNIAASPEPTSATHYVKSGETLHQIATTLQPKGTTLAQVMIAITQENPEAFDEDNVHRMKAGVILKLPEAERIRNIDPQLARQKLISQTKEFKKVSAPEKNTALPSNQKVATADSKPAIRSHSGLIRKQTIEQSLPELPKDQLKLSSPNPSDKQNKSSEISALDTLANEKSLADSTQRIAELEKNIRELQDQLALRNPPSTAPQQQEPAEQSAQQPDAKSTVASPSGSLNAQTTMTSNRPTIVPPVKNEYVYEIEKLIGVEDFFNEWDSETLALIGTAGAASLAGLLLFMRIRRRKRLISVPSVRREPAADEASVFGQAGGRHVDTNHSVFHSNFVPSVSQLDTKEVDPIAEADVYIAYGRDEQAEEILLDALKANPQRYGVHVKLLEIYAARKDQKKFAHLAAELRLLTQGLGPEWRQAAQLGQKLEAGNPLYASSASAQTVNDSSTVTTAQSFNQSVQFTPSIVKQVPTELTDFSLRLDGMLQQGRAASGSVQFSGSDSHAEVIDFTQTGVTSRLAATPAETVALKTKIDLAMACNDIGDSAGARDLLSEVASSHHPELAARAKSLLQQLA